MCKVTCEGSTVQQLLTAESAGTFYNANIRSRLGVRSPRVWQSFVGYQSSRRVRPGFFA
jgi:hypothetical protein